MITLVLGGTRSGKSELAERLAERASGDVTYIATADLDADDADQAARVARHRQRRPRRWSTIECAAAAELPAALTATGGVVLVDSLGAWVACHRGFDLDPTSLLAALGARTAPTIVVSEEVGLSIHPASELGRRFVDVLGELNRQVADIADRVLLVVAGRAVELPLLGSAQPGLPPDDGLGGGPSDGVVR